MELNEYQTAAADTAVYPGQGTPLGMIYCALKLAGEAGEVAEKIGKAMRDDNLFHIGSVFGVTSDPTRTATAVFRTLTIERREALKFELGDVLWYIANEARELGFTLDEIAEANISKLADRAARGTLQGSGDSR